MYIVHCTTLKRISFVPNFSNENGNVVGDAVVDNANVEGAVGGGEALCTRVSYYLDGI
jgi:hypothetical protein